MVSAAGRRRKAARQEETKTLTTTPIFTAATGNSTSLSSSSSAWTAVNPKLSPWLLDAVSSMGLSKMTPVQASTIPLFLGNKDVVVEAVTGSGKTLAFLIPVVERLLRGSGGGEDGERRRGLDKTRKRGQVGAVIISPTRELATQIYGVLLALLEFHAPSAATLPTLQGGGRSRGEVAVENKQERGAEEEGGLLEKDQRDEEGEEEEKEEEEEEEEDMNDITESIEPLPEYTTDPRIIPQLLLGGTQSPAVDLKKFLAYDPNVLVGTPGRLNELLSSPYVHCTADSFEVLVLDEADRLLDMGFKEALTSIIAKLPKQRRTGLFSATVSDAVVGSLVRTGLRNPVKVVVKVRGEDGVGEERRTPASLENTFIISPPHHRLYYLRQLLSAESSLLLPAPPKKVIIYLSSCASVDYFSSLFPSFLPRSYLLIPLHGKQSPNVRSKNFGKFTHLYSQRAILLTTDLAARGLDIPAVDLIIQLDGPPTDPKVFLHRCGRAGRAGRRGMAVLFLSPGREEEYIDFLAVRKTPVTEHPLVHFAPPPSPTDCCSSNKGNDDIKRIIIDCETGKIVHAMRETVRTDRAIWEKGIKAFVSHVRAYTKHMTQSIFRVKDIDWNSLVEAYALLTLPSMPELRGLITPPSTVLPSELQQPQSQAQCQAQAQAQAQAQTQPLPPSTLITLPPINLRSLPYKDPAREKARLDALLAAGAGAGVGPYNNNNNSGTISSAEEVAKRKADWEKRVESRKRNTPWSAQREGKEKGEQRREKKRVKRMLGRSEAEQEREREWRELVEEVKKSRRAKEAEAEVAEMEMEMEGGLRMEELAATSRECG